MGNCQTTFDVLALVDVMSQQATLHANIAGAWAEILKSYLDEQRRLHTNLDLLPDRLTDVTIIILVLLCVGMGVFVIQLNKKLCAFELHNRDDEEFVKLWLLGMQMDQLKSPRRAATLHVREIESHTV